METDLSALLARGAFDCACGRRHEAGIGGVTIAAGARSALPERLRALGVRRPFLLADQTTMAAAGEGVRAMLEAAGLPPVCWALPSPRPAPDEAAVGSAVMHFDRGCDGIVSVGSGVVNDTGKILAAMTGLPYAVVATAPSMDGYASSTSSMERDGLKVSLPSRAPDWIFGDLDILKNAPAPMLAAGVGDMAAKYMSLTEWKLAHLICGEYYCETVAGMVSDALARVAAAAPDLAARKPAAVQAVMEGMVIAGVSMHYAGLSRPASGMEHYFSHIWDMRALAAGKPAALHGLQCGVGTLLSLRVCDYVKTIRPSREKALRYVKNFDRDGWNERLRGFLGGAAEAMIAGERREGKYDREKHAARLEIILARWDEILAILETLPAQEDVRALLRAAGAPTTPEALGVGDVRTAFLMTKDIRDKYIVSRLLWDLGELDEAADACFG